MNLLFTAPHRATQVSDEIRLLGQCRHAECGKQIGCAPVVVGGWFDHFWEPRVPIAADDRVPPHDRHADTAREMGDAALVVDP